MAAAVSTMPALPLQLPDMVTAEAARKRRREILVSQRSTIIPDTTTMAHPVPTPITEPQTKRRKVDVAASKGADKPAKKPQMKYEPQVPMSKEETAAWRREQRRKRNRESAAASRQRQRDRITELEGEVDDWKLKVDAILEKIKKLEEATGKKAPEEVLPVQTGTFLPDLALKVVSPPGSPRSSSVVPAVVSSSSVETVQVSLKADMESRSLVGSEQELSDKMISRQAVKIADTPTLPYLPTSETTILPPDTCSSSAVKLEPIDSSLFPVKDETRPAVLTDDSSTEDEFGEFILDAVQWL